MAYDIKTDYSAKNAELQKALAAATDSATKAAIQAQITANQSSREEKIASDLTTYGKYANDSELNNAAGIIANNQLGTGYEIQKTNLNTQFDNAKQNANNDALSRGMARSSFVSDRMANLDVSRANALTQVDASKALALQNAKTSIIDNYRTNTANALNNEKAEFADNKMTYYNDYQAEINNVLGDNDPSNDWKADKLKGWRNEKLLAQEAAALKAAKGSYSGNGNGNPGTEKPKLTAAQALAAYDEAGIRTPEVVAAYTYYYGDPNYGAPKKYASSSTVLNDTAADYQVGMNRGSKGQAATVQRMLESGQITETQAEALLKKYGLL